MVRCIAGVQNIANYMRRRCGSPVGSARVWGSPPHTPTDTVTAKMAQNQQLNLILALKPCVHVGHVRHHVRANSDGPAAGHLILFEKF